MRSGAAFLSGGWRVVQENDLPIGTRVKVISNYPQLLSHRVRCSVVAVAANLARPFREIKYLVWVALLNSPSRSFSPLPMYSTFLLQSELKIMHVSLHTQFNCLLSWNPNNIFDGFLQVAAESVCCNSSRQSWSQWWEFQFFFTHRCEWQ